MYVCTRACIGVNMSMYAHSSVCVCMCARACMFVCACVRVWFGTVRTFA